MQLACSVGTPTRCHLVWVDMGGAVSWIMFLQTGCGVIPVSQFQLCPGSFGTWDGCRIPGCPYTPGTCSSPQVTRPFRERWGYVGEGIVYVGVLAAHPDHRETVR